MSPLQQGMLFDNLKRQDPALNLIQIFCETTEPLDLSAFERAWTESLMRHEVLRSRIVWEGLPTPTCEVEPQVRLPMASQDWSDHSKAEQAERFELFLAADRQMPFDLVNPPLMRMGVFRLSPRGWRWCWTCHHLLIDGRGVVLLFNEVFNRYESYLRHRELRLPTAPQYRSYIDWHRNQDWSRAEAFWRSTLSGFKAATSVGLGGDPRTPDDQIWAEHLTCLSKSTTRRLVRLAKRAGVTMNTVLQGAWAILLSRYAGEEDVVFGAIRACRKSSIPDAPHTVGLFVNTVPVRAQVSGSASLISWLHGLRATWNAMRDFENTPLPAVVAWSDIPRGERLFESILNYQETSWDAALTAQGGTWRKRAFGLHNFPGYPLTLDFYGGKGALRTKLIYDRRRFSDAAILRLMGHLHTLLEGMAASPAARLMDLPTLSPAEGRRIMVDWNATQTPYPRNLGITEVFEQQAKQTPDSIALVFGSERLTYHKLNLRANRLAHYLQAQGVKPGSCVGICMERSMEMVIGLLGVLKAGAAYVPLDPQDPKERMASLIQDAQIRLILSLSRLHDRIPQGEAKTVYLDKDWKVIHEYDSHDLAMKPAPDDLAYVIYTSGSTGHAKGVCVPHRGVVRLVKNVRYARFTAQEVFLQFAPLSIDASTLELWAPLLNGGRLILFPPSTPTLEELGNFILREGITTLWLTASLFQQMVELHCTGLSGVRQLLAGGDILPLAQVRKALRELPHCRIINGYGPTENTTFTCCYPIPALGFAGDSVPIGRPICNTTVYVLDHHLQPVPVGVPGELFTGGDGLARGYLNEQPLTQQRFLANPFSKNPHSKLYRTGDRVRWSVDGDLEFLGRRDFQVKIRGFRIELESIEAALIRHPAVREAAVAIHDDHANAKRLIAYLVVERDFSLRDARQFLKERLPEYMIPSLFVPMEALPLSSHGKVNRKALPRPDLSNLERAAYVPPSTPTEIQVAQIWSEILKAPTVGATDHFFELGGHSLLAMQMIARLRNDMGLSVPLRLLFEKPTVETLSAALLTLDSKMTDSAPSLITPAARGGNLPLSFFQERIWTYAANRSDGVYNQPVLLRIKGPLDFDALQRSLTEVFSRHEVFRTTFATDGSGVPVQIPHPPASVPVTVLEMGGQSITGAALKDLLQSHAQCPFDLQRDPMFRVVLLRWSVKEHHLLLTFHALAYDGILRETFFQELGIAYAAYLRCEQPCLPVLSLQYVDFALWQRQVMQPSSAVFQKLLGYWSHKLAGQPRRIEFPFVRAKPPIPDLDSAYRIVPLPLHQARSLASLSRERGVTLFMTLLAGFKTLLHCYTGATDIMVGSYFGNRNHPELQGVVGLFSNLLPLRSDLSGDPSFLTLLDRVRETVLNAQEHQDLPFEELCKAFAAQGQMPPEIQAIFMLTNTKRPLLRLEGLRVRHSQRLSSSARTMPWGFSLNIEQCGEKLWGGWVANTDEYDPAAITQMTGLYGAILAKVITEPDAPLSNILPNLI